METRCCAPQTTRDWGFGEGDGKKDILWKRGRNSCQYKHMESERRRGKKKCSVHHEKPPTSKSASMIGFISKHGFCNLHNCEGNLNAEQKAFRAEQTHPSNVFVIEVPS